jgi:co-chaperonin GroES (HSP10)
VDKPNTLQLTNVRAPEVDWRAASRHLRPLSGRVAVEMLLPEDRFGLILLPDSVAGNLRPDVGVVVGAGRDVPLEPGDLVIVRPYDGVWRVGFEAGEYRAKSELRTYGVFVPRGALGEAQLVEWWDSVVARLDDAMTIRPLGKNTLIRRDPEVTQEGSILLATNSGYRTNIGTVVACGPLCEIAVGNRVLYHPEGALDFDQVGGDPDLALMNEDAIELVLTEELALA